MREYVLKHWRNCKASNQYWLLDVHYLCSHPSSGEKARSHSAFVPVKLEPHASPTWASWGLADGYPAILLMSKSGYERVWMVPCRTVTTPGGWKKKIDNLISNWFGNVILSSSSFMHRKDTDEGMKLLSVGGCHDWQECAGPEGIL